MPHGSIDFCSFLTVHATRRAMEKIGCNAGLSGKILLYISGKHQNSETRYVTLQVCIEMQQWTSVMNERVLGYVYTLSLNVSSKHFSLLQSFFIIQIQFEFVRCVNIYNI